MPGGRPSEYKEEYNDKVDDYLATCVDTEYDWTKTDGDKTTSFEHRVKVQLPTIEGFAIFIGVPRRTVFDWRDANDEFSHSLDKILVEQKKRLLNKGLSGDYNSTIAKLILSSNHEMSERTDITSGGKRITMTDEEKLAANNALQSTDE